MNRREFHTNWNFRRKYTNACRIFVCRIRPINTLVDTNRTWRFLIWIQRVFAGSITDNFYIMMVWFREKNSFLLSYLRVEFPHTLRRDKILVHFWNFGDISTEEKLVRWVVLLNWNVCGVATAMETKPQSDRGIWIYTRVWICYFLRSQSSVLVCRPFECLFFFLRIFCKESMYNLFEDK
jgi:hypothetical protein